MELNFIYEKYNIIKIGIGIRTNLDLPLARFARCPSFSRMIRVQPALLSIGYSKLAFEKFEILAQAEI